MADQPRVVILVPMRAGFEDRDRLWQFVREWWAREFPDWPIVEGDHLDGPFNRGAALNAAAANAGDWDVGVFIDADVLIDPEPVRVAAQIAHTLQRPVLAYHQRVHLSRHATTKILDGFMGDWRQRGFERSVFYDSCSSAYVVHRELFDEVGGFDESFVGWGWEDVAFRCATETVSGHELVKIAATLFHLHHVVSSGNNPEEPTFVANRERGEAYVAARFDMDKMKVLLAEAARARQAAAEAPLVAVVEGPTRIPRILHRTVGPVTSAEVDGWWARWGELHPGWELMDHRDPLDRKAWPLTGRLWSKCATGAQVAGLIRLEALHRWGGVYVDSDVEPYRPLDPLLHLPAFAGWEDAKVVPDAVLGAEPGHPAIAAMLALACQAVEAGAGAWDSGPGVSTRVLPGRPDVLLLPPGSFYPYHYNEKATRRSEDHASAQPWAFGAHHWHASWVQAE